LIKIMGRVSCKFTLFNFLFVKVKVIIEVK